MQEIDTLIRTKPRPPFLRLEPVPRPRLQAWIMEGLRGPLTLIFADAGYGKTTLLASCVAGCGVPITWLSRDKNHNQAWRFLNYLIVALQEADDAIGSEAAWLLAEAHRRPLQQAWPSPRNAKTVSCRVLSAIVFWDVKPEKWLTRRDSVRL